MKAALADKDRARLLQAQKQAQRVLRVLRRWLRESMAGSFVWWRRATTVFLGEGPNSIAAARTNSGTDRPAARGLCFCVLATGCSTRRRDDNSVARVRPKPTKVESELQAASFVFWARVVGRGKRQRRPRGVCCASEL